MTQSLAQLQAEWRAMKDEGVSDFDSGVVAGFGGAANELQPHVEREAADLELIEQLASELERAYRHGGYSGGEGTSELVKQARARLEESKP